MYFIESIQYLVIVSQTLAAAPSSKLQCIKEISQVCGCTAVLKAQSEQGTLHQLQWCRSLPSSFQDILPGSSPGFAFQCWKAANSWGIILFFRSWLLHHMCQLVIDVMKWSRRNFPTGAGMMQYVNWEYSSNRDDDGMDTLWVDLWIKKLVNLLVWTLKE